MVARALILGLMAAIGARSTPQDAGGEPVVAATFYAWYDAATGAHFQAADGRELLRHHLPDPRVAQPDSVDWFSREIVAAAAAGIDVLLLENVPAPAGIERSLPALRAALEATAPQLARPLRVALLLDPYFVAVERAGGEGSGPVAKLDLGDPFQLAALMTPVERFFAGVPRAFQATVDGAPLLVIGPDAAVGARPDDLFAQMERSVASWTGRTPWLLADGSWSQVDRPRWRAGSALLGAQIDGAVASLGPGYDGRLLLGSSPLLRLRDGGETYAAQWQKALAAHPRLVLLESWNQLHDGSALCPTIEHGDRYVELTRHYAELLRAGRVEARAEPRVASSLVLAESYSPDRELALADDAAFRPSDEQGGVRLVATPFEAEAAKRAATLEFVRDPGGRAQLRLSPASGEASGAAAFAVSPVFAGVAAGAYELEIDAEPVADRARVTVTASRSKLVERELEPKAGGTISASFEAIPAGFEVECTAPIAIRSIALHRRDRRLPRSRLGISDDRWFESLEVERLAAARKLGAQWFRFQASWDALAPEAGRLDVARLGDAVDAVRAAGMEPIVALADPPRWAQPVAARPDEVAKLVDAIARRCAGRLRLLELFPGANGPGGFSRVPDAQGTIRVLRAAAKAARAVDPALALVLGGVRGPDRVWLDTIDQLHESFAYDATMLLADDESGAIDSRSFGHELDRLAGQLASGGDAGKPFFVELGAATAPSPLLAPERRALLPAVIRAAWRRLERTPTTVHLLDEKELPCVRGLTAGHARDLLEAAGIAVAPHSLDELIGELRAQHVQTLLLEGGEIVPRELLPLLPEFVDRGGLLVTLGSAPFRRSAVQLEGGIFEVDDDASPSLALRDDLRIALARFRPGLDVLPEPRSWKSGPSVPGLAEEFAAMPSDGALFTARTGLPRNDHGFHRYEPLLVAQAGGRELGDVAALIAFAGARAGALLLIGLDAQDRGRSPSEQASALRAGFDAARRSGARVVFWHSLADSGPASGGDGLFDPAGAPREAARVFEALAASERASGK